MKSEQIESRFTVLLVDDSPLIHKIVKRVLDGDYHTVAFESGEEALAKLDDIKPDLVLLDVEMPGIDGFQTIKLMKLNKNMAEVPIIFLTGKNDVKFEFEALELGAVDYINKPFANTLLHKRVEIHLAHAIQKRTLANYNEDLKNKVEEKTEIIRELQCAIIYTLADLVEMRDNSTGGHVLRTQSYIEAMLDCLQEKELCPDSIKKIDKKMFIQASQLHDVGKVAIPDSILQKPARLSPKEFDIIKTHTTIGYKALLRAMELTHDKAFLNFAAEAALNHHEKWDGTGYPAGLSGEEIPITGRLMAIADVYDALVSERHYKAKMTHEEALKVLMDGKGSHFDPLLIDAVMEIQDKFNEISMQSKEPV